MKMFFTIMVLFLSYSAHAYNSDVADASVGTEIEINEMDEVEAFLKFEVSSNDNIPSPAFHVKIDKEGSVRYLSLAAIEGNANIDAELNSEIHLLKFLKDKRKSDQEVKAFSALGGKYDYDFNQGSEMRISPRVLFDVGYEEVDFTEFKQSLSSVYGELGYGLVGTYDPDEGDFVVVGTVQASQKRHLNGNYKEDNAEAKLEFIVDRYSKNGRSMPLYFYVTRNLDYKQEADFGLDGTYKGEKADYSVGFEMGF